MSAATQTDGNITKIICPSLQFLKPVSSTNQIPSTTPSMPTVSTPSSSTQAHLLPSTSSLAASVSEPQSPIHVFSDVLFTSSNMFTPIKTSSTISASSSNSGIFNPILPVQQHRIRERKKTRDRKRKKELLKTIRDIKMAQHRPKKSALVDG
ncbi:hypothetical protein TNCV_905551 [Trichonephila clavipes]|nr:hypothetical protein TNCV_905551 [Trichonephila clavipes]